MLKILSDETECEELSCSLDAIVWEGARRMLAAALEAEVAAYVETALGDRDEDGHALVVRNGRARSREILTGAGAVEVRAPRVNDKRTDPPTGERQRFRSAILPPYMRRSPKVNETLPVLYLQGCPQGTPRRPWRSSLARRRGCRRR